MALDRYNGYDRTKDKRNPYTSDDLEAMRRFDAKVDAEALPYEKILDEKDRYKRWYDANRARCRENQRRMRERRKAGVPPDPNMVRNKKGVPVLTPEEAARRKELYRERKRRYYLAHRERIREHQRQYLERKKEASA